MFESEPEATFSLIQGRSHRSLLGLNSQHTAGPLGGAHPWADRHATVADQGQGGISNFGDRRKAACSSQPSRLLRCVAEPAVGDAK
jgi:hypothetical protein